MPTAPVNTGQQYVGNFGKIDGKTSGELDTLAAAAVAATEYEGVPSGYYATALLNGQPVVVTRKLGGGHEWQASAGAALASGSGQYTTNFGLATPPVIEVPEGQVWQPISLSAVFQTGAESGKRVPMLVVQPHSTGTYEICSVLPSSTTIKEKETWAINVVWGAGQSQATAFGEELEGLSGIAQIAVPSAVLYGGQKLELLAIDQKTTDKWTAVLFGAKLGFTYAKLLAGWA